jgi:hypothetical protein
VLVHITENHNTTTKLILGYRPFLFSKADKNFFCLLKSAVLFEDTQPILGGRRKYLISIKSINRGGPLNRLSSLPI